MLPGQEFVTLVTKRFQFVEIRPLQLRRYQLTLKTRQTALRDRFWIFLPAGAFLSPLPHTRDARVRIVDLLGPLIETSSLKFSRVLTYVIMTHEHNQSMSVAFLES